MKAYVIETAAGLFIIDENADVIEKALFSSEPREAAVSLKQIQDGQLTATVLDALKRAQAKYSPLIFEVEATAKAAENQGKLTVSVKSEKPVDEFRKRLGSDWKGRDSWLKKQSLESQIFETPASYNEFVRQVTLQIARAGIALAAANRDLSAVQAVRAMDDLDKTLNLLAGRVREWYGLHFPEMDRLVEKHDTYARLVATLGNRNKFTHDNLVAQDIPKEKAEEIAAAARRSMGAEIAEPDLAVLQSFCGLMLDLNKFRGKSESYVEEVLKEVAPNMAAIVGSALSARLISIAGSLNNLAKMPASTLQVLGAEKALFRSLKTGARPPKHGVIFQYTAIHQSPRWQRGKIARTLSGKLSIAARVDAFGGTFMGEKLRDDVKKKIDEIKEKYKTPIPAKKKSFGRKR
ncbi:MAG: C/D box methylation guide ribonucleoprotein complex aNOP56 subunit [Candidatus Bathyarchaeia archaeon]